MLTAYFDDSGTHTGGRFGPSKIVLVAGLFGTEARLDSLDRNWHKHLQNPLCGRKEPIRRFHAYDCDNSLGEFAGWKRTETDYFCRQLQDVIIEADVGIYGIAVARQDWDDLVTGDVRGFAGDAESYCISQCFVRSIKWAEENTFDPAMSFVFDNRTPEIHRRGGAIGHAFQHQREQLSKTPQIAGTAFMSSMLIRPLQAADMIAWEVYQHANEILSDGVMKPPKRDTLKRFDENLKLMTQLARRPQIQGIVDFLQQNTTPGNLKAMANHFTFFDPAKPDFSYLYGEQPE